MTDSRDNQVYKTVVINGLTWLAENVRYDLPNQSTSVGYCHAPGKDTSLIPTTGYVCNYLGATNMCDKAQGWRLPTDSEISSMIKNTSTYAKNFLSTDYKDYSLMNDMWKEATNKYGLNLIPSDEDANTNQMVGESGFWTGSTYTDGSSSKRAYFYSASNTYEYSSVLNRYINYYGLFRVGDYQSAYHPVRCVKKAN